MGETSSPSTASARVGNAIALLACLAFFAAGQAFVPLLGIQNDEALFGNALFAHAPALYSIPGAGIPLMVITYMGALKAWIYAPVFRYFGAGVWQVREPVVVIGAVSVWLFFLLLRRVAGMRAAVIGACLLAVDSDYLMTVCYDWGPVALQHLLLIGGVLLVVRFCQTREPRALAGGFFLFGLAMWDKALAIWLLSGMAVAVLTIYGQRVLSLFTLRRAAIATAAFSVGALPLIAFNIHSDLSTFRQNMVRETSEFPLKVRFLAKALAGGGLFGYLEFEDSETPSPHAPSNALERVSAKLAGVAGHPRRSGMLWVLLAALLVAPLAGWVAMRAILFCLIAGAIAWLEMASNANTGASIHHTILLWPLPQAIVAIAFAGVSRRLGRAGLVAAAAALLFVSTLGLLVTNEYHAQMVRNGGTVVWSTALFRLSDALRKSTPKTIFCMDWGMLNSLQLLYKGRIQFYPGSDPVFPKRDLTEADRRAIEWMLAQPDAVFVAHTPEAESFTGANERLIQAAAEMGYRRDRLSSIPDGFGRNIFEVYRLAR
jgi:Dolichyl-phosphate-mannose-protein mannosyltransferase